ncbi:conserved hypothetical protein [Photorhabdus asymbiotica]|uniref:Uncharacterized protein n=2 Tax=Photorhabdus asymbiotica TaxID=291112 RepID=A0ABX9SMN7_9GAMM|nr:hypothetical protein BDD30_1354 [Photorhabdus asymbiotica]CAQ85419.1 conserved hypothetical protein [Photorhabdus asymbiotica]CAR67753.1 Hypothetical transmembrane protein [Photorhabdus asymbiotica subsp. asymbiotica ATCC 43949]
MFKYKKLLYLRKYLEDLAIMLDMCILLIIPVIFQVASLLATLTHPGHIVIYAPGDSFPCRRDAS